MNLGFGLGGRRDASTAKMPFAKAGGAWLARPEPWEYQVSELAVRGLDSPLLPV